MRTFDASPRPPLGLSLSPARRSPTSKDLGSSHRGAAPPQSRVPPLTARLGSPGSPSRVLAPFNGIRPRAPIIGQVVRDPPRLRSRAFSAPQRFVQACVPRPCFVPQPFLDCVPSSVPLPEIAYPSRGSSCHLVVIHLRARRAHRDLVTGGFHRLPRPWCWPSDRRAEALRPCCQRLLPGRVRQFSPPTMSSHS